MSGAQIHRVARRDDVATMLDWAAAEGWNPGLDDAGPFHAADPEGYFVAELDGKAVASISVVNHSDDMAFLGFFICRPEFRGRGIGLGLWSHALAHAGTRTIGLDGVAAQEANYARSGFVRAGASRRFAGRLPGVGNDGIRDLRPDDLPALITLDAAACGYERAAFLSAWLAPCATRRSVVLDGPGGIEGVATIRRCREGCKIGPVIAADADTALRLAAAAASRLPSEIVFIDAAPGNKALADALRGLGFEETFATARMYRGPAPRATVQLQAIATMELG